MLFSRYARILYGFAGVVLLGLGVLAGCDADLTSEDEVFSDAAQRVETNLLPGIVDESEAVLRNLLNLAAALPEICSTPLAGLGSFVSSLPALGAPASRTFDEDEGAWEMIWRGRVLGDDSPPLTVDTATPRVDVTLTVRFLTRTQQPMRAIPFSLAPLATLQTAGEPASFAAGAVEGFFLFQNADSGAWTLRWRALGETEVFQGTVSAGAGLVRVVRRVTPGDANTVSTLEINDAGTEIRFEETTSPADEKGITFFVRPGEIVRFQLRIGPEGGSPQSISANQLRIGATDQPPPVGADPGNFFLTSSLPIDPSGRPAFTEGVDRGMFIWQDTDNNDCNAATEDRWRIRFSTAGTPTTFSGTATVLEDDNQVRLRAAAVGSCPAGQIQESGRRLDYECSVQDPTPSGYDLCVTRGRRVAFNPLVDDVRNPGAIAIGSQGAQLPSPYPFAILFDVELTEQQSSRQLVFSEARVFLRGNNEEEGELPIDPDQVSLEPFCSVPGETKQRLPRVRLTGDGSYATSRFEGSGYEFENVEFTEAIDANDNPLADFRRFPERGDILLTTRLEEELENTEITSFMGQIQNVNGKGVAPMDVELNVSGVVFTFANANFPERAALTVE